MRLSGPMRDLPTAHARAVSSLKKKTLGDLTSKFHERMNGSDPPVSLSEDPQELTLALSMQYTLDPDLSAEIKRELMSLVQERNRLIHRDLVLVDFNSVEACEALSLRLDQQNVRICKQLEFLKTLQTAHLAALKELAQFVASEEFASQLGRDNGDA